MLNTVYIINSLEGGGAERVFAQLMAMLADDKSRPDNVHVVLLDKLDEVYSLPDSIEVHRIGKRAGALWPAAQFLFLLRLLIKLKPQLITSFLTRANTMNVCAAKLLGCGSIISERSNTSARLVSRYAPLKRWLVGVVYRRADCVMTNSQGIADCLIGEFGVSRTNTVVVNNPVDFEAINAQAKNAEDSSSRQGIIAMGRLVRSKGFDDLIRAYEQSGLSCGLTILGDGPERVALNALVTELGLSAQVKFHGFVANPHAEIKGAKLFVLCSHLEGFPNALLEAMALGKPVIATDCTDGPREILALNETIPLGEFKQTGFGLMVNVGDHSALANALRYLSSDSTLRQQLGAQAQSRVKQYSKQHFYSSYLGLLGRVKGEFFENV